MKGRTDGDLQQDAVRLDRLMSLVADDKWIAAVKDFFAQLSETDLSGALGFPHEWLSGAKGEAVRSELKRLAGDTSSDRVGQEARTAKDEVMRALVDTWLMAWSEYQGKWLELKGPWLLPTPPGGDPAVVAESLGWFDTRRDLLGSLALTSEGLSSLLSSFGDRLKEEVLTAASGSIELPENLNVVSKNGSIGLVKRR